MPNYSCSQLESKSVTESIIKNNVDKVKKYKMTFFKEDNTYKLKNIEKQ